MRWHWRILWGWKQKAESWSYGVRTSTVVHRWWLAIWLSAHSLPLTTLSFAQLQTCNLEPQTSNLKPRTSNFLTTEPRSAQRLHRELRSFLKALCDAVLYNTQVILEELRKLRTSNIEPRTNSKHLTVLKAVDESSEKIRTRDGDINYWGYQQRGVLMHWSRPHHRMFL